jgi:hypothetical protein
MGESELPSIDVAQSLRGQGSAAAFRVGSRIQGHPRRHGPRVIRIKLGQQVETFAVVGGSGVFTIANLRWNHPCRNGDNVPGRAV